MIVARAGTAGQEPGRLCIDTHPRTKTYDCLDMPCLVSSPSLISTDSYHLSVISGLLLISLALKQVSSSVDEANEHKQTHTPLSTTCLYKPTPPSNPPCSLLSVPLALAATTNQTCDSKLPAALSMEWCSARRCGC